MLLFANRVGLVQRFPDCVFGCRNGLTTSVSPLRLRHRPPRATENDLEEDPLGQFCPVPKDQQPLEELKELQVKKPVLRFEDSLLECRISCYLIGRRCLFLNSLRDWCSSGQGSSFSLVSLFQQ